MAGDHKCPMCPATFTRPQHVGRHLRAHTGDRPYECKECPLRFARSDLLSRHVNKAHRPPEEGEETKKDGKKGRRKSFPTTNRAIATAGIVNLPPQPTARDFNLNGVSGLPSRQAFAGDTHAQAKQAQAQAQTARRASVDQLQAQRMYPNHPLLAGTPAPVPMHQWNNGGGMFHPGSGFESSYTNQALGTVYAGQAYTPTSMQMQGASGSDQGVLAAPMMGRASSGLSGSGWDFGFKKKACDQCNHSKVRCDFNDPCQRCMNRNVVCSYNKPSKSRNSSSHGTSYPLSASSSTEFALGTSPTSQFASPTASSLTSPINVMSPMNQFMPQPVSAVALPQVPNAQQVPWTSTMPQGIIPTHSTVPTMGWWPDQFASGVDPSLGYMPGIPQGVVINEPNYTAAPPVQIMGANPGVLGRQISMESTPGLAPTPSLTSHATSPSSSDDPPERRTLRMASNGSITVVDPAAFNPAASLPIDDNPGNLNNKIPIGNSMYPSGTTMLHMAQPDLTQFQWPMGNDTINPRTQFRTAATSSDEDDDVPPPAVHPIFQDNEDAQAYHAERRRRSSAGLWSTAFNSMSLQDRATMGPMPLPDPFTAVQVAQEVQQRRPTFPLVTVPEGSTGMNNLSDVKDLWKLFMSDAMQSSTPAKEKTEGEGQRTAMNNGNSTQSGGRPMFERGLSRSNSAPDLTSPSLLATQMYDGIGANAPGNPKAAPSHTPAQGLFGHAADNTAEMKKWKHEIQHRQTAFNFQPAVKMHLKSFIAGATPAAAVMPHFRPSVSIVQQGGALQQTLAPERAPSYGLTPNSEQPNPTMAPPLPVNSASSFQRTPTKLSQSQSSMSSLPQSLASVTSISTQPATATALARPGTKRLPSQTLGPDEKKRSASFSLWDGEDDGNFADAEDEGLNGLLNELLVPPSSGTSGPASASAAAAAPGFTFPTTPVFSQIPSNGSLTNLNGHGVNTTASNFAAMSNYPPLSTFTAPLAMGLGGQGQYSWNHMDPAHAVIQAQDLTGGT